MRPKRVLGYCRVSSAIQARGTSLADQQKAIETYAKARGLEVAKFYVEAESSVRERIESRHQMRALLEAVRQGDLVLCDNLDRWSRDPEFTFKSIREMREKGAHFYSVGDSCDPETSDGDTMLNFRILFAREEHKRIKRRLVGTRKTLRTLGYYVEGLPPFGYARAHPKGYRGAEKNILVIVEPQVEVVRKAFSMSAAGFGLEAIREATGLAKSQACKMLHNRHYLGEVFADGKWIPGRHPPIVTRATFDSANQGLTARRYGGARASGHQGRTATWMLRDVAFCGLCGRRMTVRYSAIVGYYICRYYTECGGKSARVDHVEAGVGELVLAHLAELREQLSSEPESARQVIPKDAASQRARLHARRERFLEAFADGHMVRATLAEKLAKIDADLLALEVLDDEAPSPLKDTRVRREMLREVAEIKRGWNRATAKDRRELVALLATRAEIVKDRPPVMTWRSAEDLLVNR